MRYLIEYLEETTEEESVCDMILAREDDLEAARNSARAYNRDAADGFQIRDLLAAGEIVVVEDFTISSMRETMH